ncbi:hypothetical protein [Streptomyces sp. ISL-11]|uniref:hypothetical protein n=1 Tax=Streptomyces sp. ISL-11 TaxID=2819174 RepID=UPI001BE6703D|nr:hypothetical protein [Streptomyces sp. ISL-11]MBT2387241.1 hypothetical protein [Streptomyces sp. ISL-11]
MVAQPGLLIHVAHRGFPLTLVGGGGGALALWVDVPLPYVIPVVLMVALRVTVRRVRPRKATA